jgi:hypothetical protein
VAQISLQPKDTICDQAHDVVRMCLWPTLEFQMWQSSGKVPVVSRYSIGLVLATNPSYSLKT